MKMKVLKKGVILSVRWGDCDFLRESILTPTVSVNPGTISLGFKWLRLRLDLTTPWGEALEFKNRSIGKYVSNHLWACAGCGYSFGTPFFLLPAIYYGKVVGCAGHHLGITWGVWWAGVTYSPFAKNREDE